MDINYKEQTIDSKYDQIKGITAFVGGYFAGYYNVNIDLTTGSVTWSHEGGGQEKMTYHKHIRKTTIKKLVEEFKMINLLEWEPRYILQGVCDGTQWGIEVVQNEKSIKKSGDNMFPNEWSKFCSIVQRITNKKFN